MATYLQHANNSPAPDPFDDFEKVPAVSWADAPVGTVVKGTISRLPKEVQDLDFRTKEPKFWKSGEPQMSVVMHIDITDRLGGVETRSLWAKKPSSMYRALGQAQKDAGAKFALGGTLYIRLERTEPSKTAGFHPQKIYAAKYEPPTAAADPWGAPSPQAPQPQPTQRPTTPPPVQQQPTNKPTW